MLYNRRCRKEVVKLDGDKLWDLFLVVFGVAAAKVADALEKRLRTRKAPKGGEHFKEP